MVHAKNRTDFPIPRQKFLIRSSSRAWQAWPASPGIAVTIGTARSDERPHRAGLRCRVRQEGPGRDVCRDTGLLKPGHFSVVYDGEQAHFGHNQ